MPFRGELRLIFRLHSAGPLHLAPANEAASALEISTDTSYTVACSIAARRINTNADHRLIKSLSTHPLWS
jgi:hypothetical protein